MRVLVITALLLGFAIAIPLEDGRGPFGMCDTCHVAVKIAQDFFNDKATPTLLGAAVSDEACAHMECPYQKKKCTALSHSLPSLFIKWFAATATPASMCSDQHVCRGVQPAMQPVGDDSTLCGMCKYVVSRVQGSLNDTSVQEDIKQKLLKYVVSRVQGSLNDTSVQEDIKKKQLKPVRDDPTLCGMGKFVVSSVQGSQNDTAVQEDIKKKRLKDVFIFISTYVVSSVRGSMNDTAVLEEMKEKLLKPVRDDPTLCGTCEFVVSSVQGSQNDTAVQEDIKKKRLKICGDLPGDISTNCTDFVNKYEPIITDFINTAEPEQPEKVCELIGTCTSAPASTMTLWTQPPPALPATLVSGLAQMRASTSDARFLAASPNDMCDVCQMAVIEMAVIEAHSLIQSPTVQEEIVNYTKAICNTMGSSADACRKYVG
eukprot:gene8802-33673_t